MAVEKGQKYKGNGSGDVYEILSDPFVVDGYEHVAYRLNGGRVLVDHISGCPSLYTLIREPKFKVGDRATYYGAEHEVVAVSEKTDQEGDFGYLVLDSDGYFNLFDDSCGLKAAE